MKLGDILEVTILDNGMSGEGIAKVDNLVIFIPFVLKGERVKVEITHIKKNFVHARCIKMIEPSERRVESVCPLFRKCGGCDLQHVAYSEQLAIKKNEVINCFTKNAHVDITDIIGDTVPSDKTLHYRNKVQMPIGEIDGKIYLGFYRENSHYIIPIDSCPLHDSIFDGYLRLFVKWANRTHQSAYNEKSHKGLLRHIILRKVGDMVAIQLVINGDSVSHLEKLLKAFDEYNKAYTLHININKARTNVILGKKSILINGTESIDTTIQGVKVAISPMSFMQINNYICEKIYSAASDIFKELESPIIIDAYSGIGILSNIFARYAKKVYGIEIVEDAVQNANSLKHLNGNDDKIENICGDSAKILPDLMDSLKIDSMKNGNNDNFVLLLDPPRKGVDEAVLDAVLRTTPHKIVYISCNPATLARDYNILKERYNIVSITPYDMFPNTRHVETLLYMELAR